MAPQPEVVDIFRLKYDYHNLKTLVKAAGAQVSGDRLLSDCGRVPADKLKAAVEEDRLSDLPADMAAAYESARSLLARTGNPSWRISSWTRRILPSLRGWQKRRAASS